MKKLALVLALMTTVTISYADPATTPATATPAATTAPAAMPIANTAPAGTPTTGKPVAYIVPQPPAIDAKAYLLIDANSGKVLASSNADVRRQPASLTKLMTIYITFRELAAGHIQLTDQVTISKNAWQTGGSRMFVGVGSKVPLEDLLQGAIVASGNDSTTALAEYIGGTEPVFVQMMNQQAQQLGMNDTNYTDATGLPNPNHYSTANDLAKLANAIVHNFPQYYHYFGEKWFTWNGIRQPNRNRLLWRDDGVDGMKTGHTDDAGYCLIGSAQENGMRLISVVLGAPSENSRIEDSEALLKYGFRFYETHQVYAANQAVTQARVWGGDNKMVDVGSLSPIYVTVPTGTYSSVQATTTLNPNITAPVTKGQQLGTINFSINGNLVVSEPLVALQDDAKGGMFRRFADWVSSKF